MISLCLPTRQRPQGLKRLIDSIKQTVYNIQNIELIVYIDDDDFSYDNEVFDIPINFIKGPRIIMSDMWNKCADQANGNILMLCADDIVFIDTEWDRKVEEKVASFPDQIVLVYGEDGHPIWDAEGRPTRAREHATHPFVTKKWAETVGYFIAPYFSCDWADQWLNDVARGVGRYIFMEDIKIKHMHPSWGAGEIDSNYNERLARDNRDHNRELYYSNDKINERAANMEALRKVMQ